jgi:hypothetical protein
MPATDAGEIRTLAARKPIARIDHQIAHGPVFVVEIRAAHRYDGAITGDDVIAA